jgi:predicted O-linked N-acetylglucosamine transferase (SPINDLY family)
MTHVDTLQPSDVSKLDAACAKGMELQLAGQLDLAGQLYRAILQAAPQHAAANYCLGMLHVQSRRPADGVPYLKAALLAQLEVPDYWLGYLEALILVDRTTAARNILALGLQHGLAGAAVEDFAKRLEAQSTRAAEGKSTTEAPRPTKPLATVPAAAAPNVTKSRKSTRKSRRNEDLLFHKQEATLLSLVGQHKNAAALTLARSMTERFPQRGLGWKILGAFMSTEGGYEKALGVMQTAVRLMPEDAEAHVNLGVTLAKVQRFAEAEFHLHRALELNPELAAAHFRLGMTLELQGRYADAEASLRRGRAMELRTGNVAGDDELSYSHLLFLMSHNPSIDGEELLAEHRRYGKHVETRLRASWPRHANDRNPDRCLTVGFVSGDLYEHSVGQFLEPIVAHLTNRPGVELHAYCANSQSDALSRRLQAHFESWNPIDELSDSAMASKIMDDRIDVLIDLSGHTGHNRLPVFARKPAPVQVSWLGYPGTTGLQAMDYYLADKNWLPPGQFDRMFAEKLAYLPDRWAFKPHAGAPAVGPLPALETGRLTFGSFQRLGKINSATIQLWSQLLLAVPQATLLVLGIPVDGPEKHLLEQFAAHGVEPQRLTLHGRCTMDIYLAFHNQVDIGLDTLTYAGATTTMHSLSMGVPTLTVVGATPQARAGAGILANVGLDQFIAANTADFIEKARYWAEHLAELADLRAGLRTRLLQSPGGQPELIATHFEAALRHMWRRWCAGSPAESFAASLPVKQ